jgi:hypothetical protein
MRAITFVAKIVANFAGAGKSRFVAPIIFKIAGRTKYRNVTKAETDYQANQTLQSPARPKRTVFRFNRDSPDVDLCAERTQIRDQIMFAHRYAAADNKH